jgi:hypothetical protein
MITRILVVVVVALVCAVSLDASERKDITPGEANWQRYQFVVVTGGSQVAVRQHVTVMWENAQTGMLVAIYNTENPASPRAQAISIGNDRFVALDVGLLPGTYQIVVAAVSAPTHYHLNSTYGEDELLFQQPNGPLRAPIDLFAERLIGEQLAPYLERLATAHTGQR